MTDYSKDEKEPCCGDMSLEDCHKAMEQLEDFLDRDLTLDDRIVLEKHLRLCDHCAEEYDLRNRAQAILRSRLCDERCPDNLRKMISNLIAEECEGC